MRTREITCDYQPYISQPPVTPDALHRQACSNDEVTMAAWMDKWLANIRANKKKFSNFSDHSLGKYFGVYLHRPVIIAGSGPSLKYNIDDLKDRKGIPLISCLHNFHYFEDRGIDVDFYVSLDAGHLPIEEVSEGGEKTEAEYWELTKGKKLLAFIGTHPELLEKWQGEVCFFNAPVPSQVYQDEVAKIEVFNTHVSNGGNVLGACLYISKAFLGAGAVIFTGADFSFGYDRKFHSWDSKYDAKMGACIPAVDVFGNKVLTWQSYQNFKGWFDSICIRVPGVWINCTEGGTLGAYRDGNISNIRQMDLKECVEMYSMSELLKEQATDPTNNGEAGKRVLF
jgi:hypothetical protein